MSLDPAAPPRLRSVRRPLRLATARVVGALLLREMSSTYGRTPGGYVWAVLEPVAALMLMSVLFSVAFHAPPLGSNFAMFYATGLMPFYVFSTLSQRVAQSLNYSKQLLAYPRVTMMDAVLARLILNTLMQLLVAFLILGALPLVMHTGTMVRLPSILLGFSMAVALGAGIGVLNCYLLTRFPIWQQAWGIATRPLVLVSGVMLLVESVPRPWSDRLAWNPLAHVVAEVREGFYFGYSPSYVDPPYVFAVALACGAAGLLFLWRYHRDLLET